MMRIRDKRYYIYIAPNEIPLFVRRFTFLYTLCPHEVEQPRAEVVAQVSQSYQHSFPKCPPLPTPKDTKKQKCQRIRFKNRKVKSIISAESCKENVIKPYSENAANEGKTCHAWERIKEGNQVQSPVIHISTACKTCFLVCN